MIGLPRVSRRSALVALALGTSVTLAATILPSFAEDAVKPEVTNPDAGQAIYASSFKNLKDTNESLASLRGKVTVVYFWATWCVPCRVDLLKHPGLETGSVVHVLAKAVNVLLVEP